LLTSLYSISMQSNITIACPIVYGSIAFYLGKKSQEFQTHRWTLYIRGPQDEDLSTFISKVVFTLHPSFAQPVREVTQPPFQITETGWGEFEAGIRIFFKDGREKPVDIFHHLRLYPPSQQQLLNTKKPVVAENYDEIVFRSPPPAFQQCLMQYGAATRNRSKSNKASTAWPEHYLVFDDSLDMEVLLGIQRHLQKQLLNSKRTLINLDAQLVEQGLLAAEQAAIEANTQALVDAELQQSSSTSWNASMTNAEMHVKEEVTNEINSGTDMMEVS
jgi:YEATS domain-containing protein 4